MHTYTLAVIKPSKRAVTQACHTRSPHVSYIGLLVLGTSSLSLNEIWGLPSKNKNKIGIHEKLLIEANVFN